MEIMPINHNIDYLKEKDQTQEQDVKLEFIKKEIN